MLMSTFILGGGGEKKTHVEYLEESLLVGSGTEPRAIVRDN